MQTLRKAFSQPLKPEVASFVACIEDDASIIDADIAGSIAHCQMLGAVGLLTSDQAAHITDGLARLRESYANGEIELIEDYEDVHMNVEKQLQSLIGSDALRLHTARSRNDQVALDMRIYVHQQIRSICGLLKQVQLDLITLAQNNIDTVMPGYTHLQRAQPVSLAHALHAFVEMLARDVGRFIDTDKRTMVSPLGAGALAGSSLPIQSGSAAEFAGFASVFANSIDAVSDRDFLVEFTAACSICSIHLSQLAETFILWATSEFSFIELGDDVTTSSSLMPNKKNPDPLEIMRAKCGSMVGDLVSLLTILKGLPIGYNRDLQETKGPVIRTAKTLQSALVVLRSVVASISVCERKMFAAASDPLLCATDLVEYLVRRGMPFRQAHETIAEIVGWCRSNQRRLSSLSPVELQQFNPLLDSQVLELIDSVKSLASKTSAGGTAPDQVRAALRKSRGAIET